MNMAENVNTTLIEQNRTEYQLTESEQKLLDVLTNPDYRMKSIKEICAIAAIGRTTYYAAFKKPEFKELYKSASKALVDQAVAPVLNTFVREALRGSFQHGKVILEMAGLYSEKLDIDVNGEVNINLPAPERRTRIAELLSKKQLDSAIPVDYEVVPDK
jgi:HSP20 family molecular chaperone IbpA